MTDGSGDETHPSTARRIAHALIRMAARMLPSSQQRWGMAMLHEAAHAGSDGEAVRWALGCLYAACVERLRSLYLLDIGAIRVVAALLASFRAFDAGMPTLLTLAYRARAAAASSLGRFTPGDDYRRLVPLMESIPMWLHTIVVVAVALYALAAVATLRRRPIAAGFWCLAVAVEQMASFAARPILADVGIVVVQHPSVAAAVLLPIVMPLLIAMAAWSGSRAALVRHR
jgi:hypothetical protein